MSELDTPNSDEGEVTATPDAIENQSDDILTDETEVSTGDEETAGADDSDGAQGQEQQIALDDIAAALGLDVDDLDVSENGQVVLKTKVDGVDGTVTFKDSQRSYQVQSNLDKKGMEANQRLEQLKAQANEQAQVAQAKLQQLEDLSRIAIEELQAEASAVDWNELRANNPGEFAAKQAELQQRQQRIVSRIQAIQQERANIQQTQQAQYIEKAEAALVAAFPEWTDVEVGRKEMAEIRAYGVKLGFPEQQMATLSQAPAFLAIKKAMLYDALQQSKPEITKLVKKAPKVSKPGNKPAKKLLSAEDLFYGT